MSRKFQTRVFMVGKRAYDLYMELDEVERQVFSFSLKAAAEDYQKKQDKTDQDCIRLCYELKEDKYIQIIAGIMADNQNNVEIYIETLQWISTNDFLDYMLEFKDKMIVRHCDILIKKN